MFGLGVVACCFGLGVSIFCGLWSVVGCLMVEDGR